MLGSTQETTKVNKCQMQKVFITHKNVLSEHAPQNLSWLIFSYLVIEL